MSSYMHTWKWPKPISDYEKDEVCRRYMEGESSGTLGVAYQRSARTILRLLKERGVSVRYPGNSGWADSKVTVEEIEKKRCAKNSRQRIYQRTWKYRLFPIRRRSKIKGLPFDLTAADVICPEFCPVLGMKLTPNLGRYGATDASPTLDRIIPSKGYVKGNVRIISNKANRIKSNATVEELELVLADLKNILEEGRP